MKKILNLLITSFILITCFGCSFKDKEEHHLVFASDCHSSEGCIEDSLSAMPEDIEYISYIGDMTESWNEEVDAYYSSTILNDVKKLRPDFNKEDLSIIWANHDEKLIDDADIVEVENGVGSGLIYTGKNKNGTTAYYVYAIGQYEMMGESKAKSAAEKFIKWVNSLKDNKPIIVLCHIPIQGLRGDNKGSYIWNDALNYAATGNHENKNNKRIKREVLFLHGHNHTIDLKEYYFEAGSQMPIQKGENIEKCKIWYSSLTAGYLRDNKTSTLIVIKNKHIFIYKNSNGKLSETE